MTLLPLLLCWSNSARAADPDCAGVMCATPIRKGQPSPVDGLVLTADLAAKVFVMADSCKAFTKTEVEHTKRMERLDVERLQKLMAIDNEANGQRHQLLLRQLEHEQSWWRQPPFVAAAAAVITIGVVMATGYALQGVAQ